MACESAVGEMGGPDKPASYAAAVQLCSTSVSDCNMMNNRVSPGSVRDNVRTTRESAWRVTTRHSCLPS